MDKNDEDKQNIKSIENFENDTEENSLSVEGELEEIPKQTKKKKKVYKNTFFFFFVCFCLFFTFIA